MTDEPKSNVIGFQKNITKTFGVGRTQLEVIASNFVSAQEINFDARAGIDSHNACHDGVFTAPVTGRYMHNGLAKYFVKGARIIVLGDTTITKIAYNPNGPRVAWQTEDRSRRREPRVSLSQLFQDVLPEHTNSRCAQPWEEASQEEQEAPLPLPSQTRTLIAEWRDATSNLKTVGFNDRPTGFSIKIQEYLALSIEDINTVGKSFLWKTREGSRLKIHEMETRHIFFCLRKMFNPHRDRYLIGDTLPGYKLSTIKFFIWHIEERKDLPLKLNEEYTQIVSLIIGFQLPTKVKVSNFGSINPNGEIVLESRQLVAFEKVVSEDPEVLNALKIVGANFGRRKINVE